MAPSALPRHSTPSVGHVHGICGGEMVQAATRMRMVAVVRLLLAMGGGRTQAPGAGTPRDEQEPAAAVRAGPG